MLHRVLRLGLAGEGQKGPQVAAGGSVLAGLRSPRGSQGASAPGGSCGLGGWSGRSGAKRRAPFPRGWGSVAGGFGARGRAGVRLSHAVLGGTAGV